MKPRREPSAASTSEFAPGSRSFSEESAGAEAAIETTYPTAAMHAMPNTVNTTPTASRALLRAPPLCLRRSRVRWDRLIQDACGERPSVGRHGPSPGVPGTLARARGIALSGAQAPQHALAQLGLRAGPLARRDALPADGEADPLGGRLRGPGALCLPPR